MSQYNKLESSLDYQFKQQELLSLALTHRSFGQPNNERLEFLGDSLLNLIVAEVLFQRFPDAKEGDLSRVRSALVKGDTLAEIAKSLDLGTFLRLGGGELRSGGHNRSSILADAVEAIIGAIYLDSDLENCRRCVLALCEKHLSQVSIGTTGKDPKTRLQEYMQERKLDLPVYAVLESVGEAHAMTFLVECSINRGKQKCSARASSKRSAEKLAAQEMLKLLGEG